MIDSHVFEHADRDDSVVTPDLLAVITQVESDTIGQPRGRRPEHRRLVLFRRERQTGHVGTAFAREIEREAPPSRANVEYPLSRADQQLGSNMPLLIELGGVEVVA